MARDWGAKSDQYAIIDRLAQEMQRAIMDGMLPVSEVFERFRAWYGICRAS